MVKMNPVIYDTVFQFLFGTNTANQNALIEDLGLAQRLPANYRDLPRVPLKMSRIITGGLYDDVSFSIENIAIIGIEEQSTPPKNMPIRFIPYSGQSEARYLQYSGKQKKIYNTKVENPPVFLYCITPFARNKNPYELSFRQDCVYPSAPDKGDLEVIVHVVSWVDRNDIFQQYLKFVHIVSAAQKGVSAGQISESKALDTIRQRCQAEGVLTDFLDEHWNEVETMLSDIEIQRLATEGYGDMRAEEAAKKAAKETAEKLEKQKNEIAARLLKNTDLSVEVIAATTGGPLDQVEQLARQIRS